MNTIIDNALPCFTDLACIRNVQFFNNGSFYCLFKSGCTAEECRIAIECDASVNTQQDPNAYNLTKLGNSERSEMGQFPCIGSDTCTMNSVHAYAVYSGNISDIPDLSYTNVVLCDLPIPAG